MITYQPHQAVGALTAPPKVERPIVERMAERVRELGMNGIAVTKDVLFEHTDFTLEEIDEHGREACNLARSRAVRQVA
ncbi:hypothetical protein P9279_21910 [Mesorhizobium sp. WSM4962]|uniref:hypothetical protein n=1 Tax=Mesorhizobium sp. WSM4962 TaxID=3038548 RepID=UPI00241726DC|nr:hypothetical protein [Mesorhizobium sp. WSM4962]MDG4903168.1 hypothetical protein [Mesorhizobium sp. WSM4962]